MTLIHALLKHFNPRRGKAGTPIVAISDLAETTGMHPEDVKKDIEQLAKLGTLRYRVTGDLVSYEIG